MLVPPFLDLTAGFEQDPTSDVEDQARFLSQRDETVRGQEAALGVLPTHQGLDGNHTAGLDVELGLIKKLELFLQGGTAKARFQRHAFDDAGVHAFVEEPESGAPLVLGFVHGHVCVADQLFDIVVTLLKGTASKAVLRFGENAATYDFNAQKLDEMPLAMKDGKVTFRVLVDRPMYELIGGGGACYKTSGRRDMGKPIGTISLAAEGGSLSVESLTVYEMTPAWKK